MTNDRVFTTAFVKDGSKNDCPLIILFSWPWKFLSLFLRVAYIKNIKMSVTFATKLKKFRSALLRLFWPVDESSSDGETIGQVKKSPLREGKDGGSDESAI
jgi:hypothetical protein